MTRREWLEKNPPPRAAKSTEKLLQDLNAQNAKRAELVDLRSKWVIHRDYWAARTTLPAEAAKAQQEMNEANRQISEADKQLAATNDVPGRILELQAELTRAAKCPLHHTDLFRNMNRPEDMFTCELGPHHLLWVRIPGGAGQLLVLSDLLLPGLEYPICDGKAITRAQWLASHPPLHPICPAHTKEEMSHRAEDRLDVFRCKEALDQMLLWTPGSNGQGSLIAWPAEKQLPTLEGAI